MGIKNKLISMWKKIRVSVKTFVQQLFITLQLFLENGLANHSAACAFGLLLSIAPMLLLLSFFMFFAFRSSPYMLIGIIKNIPFVDIVFDEQWLSDNFLSAGNVGISGVISIFSVFWAGSIIAMSLQLGLKIIFPGSKKRNPFTENLLTLAIEVFVLIFALVMILFSRAAIFLIESFNFFPNALFLYLRSSIFDSGIFLIAVLGLVSCFAYRLVPVNAPRLSSAIKGSFIFAFSFVCATLVLGVFLKNPRYNLIYGTLGNLVVQLIKVYSFFIFFFIGAQFGFVIDSFDALLFLRLRKARLKAKDNGLFRARGLFSSVEGKLGKYLRFYKKGETIFLKGDREKEIFYLLEGEAEVFVSFSTESENLAGTLEADSFFGEMGYLLSENRSATIRAKTDAAALALPPHVFDEILKFDTGLGRIIIEHLSHRIKSGNDQITALTSTADH